MKNHRIALVVVVVVAALVPFAWLAALGADRRTLPSLGVRMALLSVLHWSIAAVALRARPDARRAGPWIAVGLASPLLASLLAFPLGVLLLPLDVLLLQPGATWATGVAGLSASVWLPHLVFPVGLAMGAFTWLVARPTATGAPRPASKTSAPAPGEAWSSGLPSRLLGGRGCRRERAPLSATSATATCSRGR